MVEYADRELQRKLIDACNLLCEHVGGKLPEGWELCMTMYRGESSLSLFHYGEEIEIPSPDGCVSSIDEACVIASETNQ